MSIVKRSVTISGHRTSVSLEEEFWRALKEISAAQERSVDGLISEIDRDRGEQEFEGGLSSAVRVYVLEAFREGGQSS